LKLYLQLSERYRFSVVKDFLTGYRRRRDGLSSQGLRMLAAYDHVMTGYRQRFPDLRDELYVGRSAMIEWLFLRSVREAKWTQAVILFCALCEHDPRRAASLLAVALPYRALTKVLVKSGLASAPLQPSAIADAREYFSCRP
jgi:hypothetical protein